MSKIRLTFFLLLISAASIAQELHVLKVFFRYGSIPETGYEYIEFKEIGGLRGGHVSLGIDSLEIGFTNISKTHVFPDQENSNGIYYWEYLRDFEQQVAGKKYLTFIIPVTGEQYRKVRDILMAYIDDPPYDYAFFGMRCASATYEVLSQIGLLQPKSRVNNIISNFYPRLFRRTMLRLARDKGYTVVKVKGRKTRIWESD